ncbi:MAG TPA: helix-turn-helix domain-containing protein, partial [Limnochorda sp.]
MSIESIGQKLREARMRAGIPLEEASNQTKIKVRILEALEAGAIDQVPGGHVYARNFVRSYARFLGMDVDALLAEFDAALPEAAKPARVLHPGPAAVRWSDEPPAFTRRRGSKARLWGAGAVVVVLAAVAVILVSWLGREPGSAELVQNPPAVEQVAAGQALPETASEPEGVGASSAGEEQGTASGAVDAAPPAAVTASQTTAASATAEAQPTTLAFEPLRIRTVVHQRSWMRVDVDGTTVYT